MDTSGVYSQPSPKRSSPRRRAKRYDMKVDIFIDLDRDEQEVGIY